MTKTIKPSSTGSDLKTLFSQFELLCDEYLAKRAPSLPENVKELLVKYSPYISVLVVLLLLPATLFALGLGALVAPFAFLGGVRYGFSFSFATLFLLATVLLYITAIPGLFGRQMSGWGKMYYATLLNAIHSLLSFELGNMIVGTIISLYFLYQVKSYYKK